MSEIEDQTENEEFQELVMSDSWSTGFTKKLEDVGKIKMNLSLLDIRETGKVGEHRANSGADGGVIVRHKWWLLRR